MFLPIRPGPDTTGHFMCNFCNKIDLNSDKKDIINAFLKESELPVSSHCVDCNDTFIKINESIPIPFIARCYAEPIDNDEKNITQIVSSSDEYIQKRAELVDALDNLSLNVRYRTSINLLTVKCKTCSKKVVYTVEFTTFKGTNWYLLNDIYNSQSNRGTKFHLIFDSIEYGDFIRDYDCDDCAFEYHGPTIYGNKTS